MKKVFISLITLILILSMAPYAKAATTGAITLNISNQDVKPGEEFSITLKATDSSNLNTVEYNSISITDKNGTTTTAIKQQKIEVVGSWSKFEDGDKTYFVYSGGATQAQDVLKITFSVDKEATAGEYNINIKGLKVYSTNVVDDTTEIGTKTAVVKVSAETNGSGSGNNTGNTNGNATTNTQKPTNSNKKLPQTGSEDVATLSIIVALVVISTISFISFRKYKNI